MKRRVHLGLVLALILMLVAAVGCGSTPATQTNTQGGSGSNNGSNAKTMTLKVADSLPTSNSISVDGVQVWMKKVEELTGGKVKFQYFPNEQLGKAGDMLELARSGTADIAYVVPSYIAGKLPLSQVVELPAAFESSALGSKLFWQMVQGPLLDEYLKNGVRPVWAFTNPPHEVFNTKKEVKVPDDLKGLKIRTAGGLQTITAQLLGAVPVSKSPTELYEAMQHGVVDGAIFPVHSLAPYKIDELAKYATNGSDVGSLGFTLSINEKLWESLPPDIQKAMIQAGDFASENIGKAMDANRAKQLQEASTKYGMKVYNLTPEEKQKWKEAMAGVEQEWLKQMKSQGLDGEKVLKARNEILQQLTKK